MKLTREYLISYIKQNISSCEFVDMNEFSDDELIQLYEKAKTNKRNLKKVK